jgi:hypothetical protein
MTLKQAQKQYNDAICTEVTHKPNTMTIEQLTFFGQMHYNKPCKVLFAQVGVRRSRIITSLKAYDTWKHRMTV